MSAAAVVKLLGIARQAVDKRRRAARLLGVTPGKRGYVYPVWQVTEQGVWPGFTDVLADLSGHNSMSQVIYFLTKNAYVDDEAPRAVLRRGELDRVRRTAHTYLEHGAA